MKSLPILSVAIAALILTGCDAMKGKATAENAVIAFHDSLDKGDFESLYTAADPDLRAAATEKDFLALLGAVHRKLGNVKASNETNFAINSYNLDTRITLQYNTTFDGGDGTETFVYRMKGDQVALVGYNINSLAMLTK